MRVLYLTPTGVFSGGERVTLSIAGEMRLRGHEAVYCGLEGPVRSHVEAAGVPFLALPRFTPETVRRAVAQCAPDLIHTMDFRASTYAALTGRPFVAHLHNNPPWLPGLSPNVFAMRFFCRRAARILTVSESVMGEFRYGAAFRDKTAVLGNAVDLAAVRKAAEEPLPACLADRGARGFDLAFFGRLTEQKQPLRFLDVLAALRKRLPELTAVMVGEGELRPQVEEGIRVNGLSDCIYRLKPYGAHSLRNFGAMLVIQPYRILVQSILSGKSSFRISSILIQSLLQSLSDSFDANRSNLLIIKGASNLLFLCHIFQRPAVYGFLVKGSARSLLRHPS